VRRKINLSRSFGIVLKFGIELSIFFRVINEVPALKFQLSIVFASFLIIGAYSGCFVVDNRFIFGFVVASREALALANFKYKLRLISNSEVNTVAKAAKKKEKKGAKKK